MTELMSAIVPPDEAAKPYDPEAGRKAVAEQTRNRDYFEAGITRGNDLIEVFVNGERKPLCVRAHRGQCWATYFATTPSGMIEHDGFGRPKLIVDKGLIEFRLCNSPSWNQFAA